METGTIRHAQLIPFVAPADRYAYRPRPGIVLDDTLDYTGTQGLATQRPYAPPRHPPLGDIFDVTVSAVQGPGGGSSGKNSLSTGREKRFDRFKKTFTFITVRFFPRFFDQKVSECR